MQKRQYTQNKLFTRALKRFSVDFFGPNICLSACYVYRYLLLPAILGELTLRITGEDRLEVVQKGKTYFVDYLKRCRQYGVTSEVYIISVLFYYSLIKPFATLCHSRSS